MPEIIEVETIVKDLDAVIRGGTIVRVKHSNWFTERKLRKKPGQIIMDDLLGWTFSGVVRVGKALVFKLENPGIGNHYVASRLGMSGHWSLKPGHIEEPVHKHWGLNIWLSNGTEQASLVYTDTRGFGTLEIQREWQELKSIQIYGPEINSAAFSIDWVKFVCSRHSVPIKAVLLRQEYFPGVGNYLASEILFSAHIHPSAEAKSLTEEQLKRLFTSIHTTIHRAAEGGGATLYSWKNAHGQPGNTQESLLVYGRKGQPCFVCGTAIDKVTVAGRGTFYCPKCQAVDWTPPPEVGQDFVQMAAQTVKNLEV